MVRLVLWGISVLSGLIGIWAILSFAAYRSSPTPLSRPAYEIVIALIALPVAYLTYRWARRIP